MAPKRAATVSSTADASTAVAADAGTATTTGEASKKRQKVAPSPHAGPASLTAGAYVPVAKLADVVIPPRTSGSTTKVLCWNVNGFRAAVKREGADALLAYLAREDADIVALQEIKVDEAGAADAAKLLAPLYAHADASTATDKGGYAGVVTFSRIKPDATVKDLSALNGESSGRVVTSTWGGGAAGGAGAGAGGSAASTSTSSLPLPLTLINVYVPNSGMKLERLEYRTGTWDPAFRAFASGLAGGAGAGSAAGGSDAGAGAGAAAASSTVASVNGGHVLIVGDLNVAFHDCDVHTPSTNRNKTPGFCDGERDGFKALLDAGFHDVWREAHPSQQQFTYWSARFNCRGQNKGWRLDYALASSALRDRVKSVTVRADFPGVDHVPLAVELG